MLNPALDQYLEERDFEHARNQRPIHRQSENDSNSILQKKHAAFVALIVILPITVALIHILLPTYHSSSVLFLIVILSWIEWQLSPFPPFLRKVHQDVLIAWNRTSVANNVEQRIRINKLLGSVGAAPKRRIDTTTNILSKHELGLLEETVQGTIQMIEQIDDGVKRLKTTSCLYYGLGASCPSIERIDRASIVRGNQGTASNRHLPLTSIRRMLADILLVQHNQLLQSSQSLSNKQQPPTISIPAVVTISWIQSARHALVDLLSEFVDGAFCPEKHDILIDQLTRQQLLSNTRANTLANLAYLVGALSWNQPNPPMSANHMSPVKQVIFEIHSRVNTLPVVLYELASMEAVRSLEGTQCCEMAIQLLNELSDLKENLVALTVKEPTKDEPLSVTVNSSEKGTEIRSMDACISSFEYVDGVEELENQLLIPAAPEPRTFVYSGTGAISKPRIENRLPKTEKSTAEPQTVYNIDTAFKSSLVSELKHHLQSIPKIPEVERRTIDKEYKAEAYSSSGLLVHIKDEVDQVLPAAGTLVDSDVFIGELSRALSEIGASCDSWDSNSEELSIIS